MILRCGQRQPELGSLSQRRPLARIAALESLTEVRRLLEVLLEGGRFFSSWRVCGRRPSLAAFHPVVMRSLSLMQNDAT